MKNYKYLLLFLFAISVFIPIGVRADTFGYNTIGTGYAATIANRSDPNYYFYRTGLVVSGVNGTVTSMSAALKKSATNDTIDTTIFLNIFNGDTDSHTLVVSKENLNLSLTTTATFYSFDVADSAVISTNNYVLDVLADATDIVTTGQTVTLMADWVENLGYGYESFATYAAGKEFPWTKDFTTTGLSYSIYATYTPGGGGGGATYINHSQVITD